MSIEDILQLVDEDEAVSLLKSLIRLNTVNPPGNEQKIVERIIEKFQHSGLKMTAYPFEPGRANLLIESACNRSMKADKHLILSGHLDTVPVGSGQWIHDPRSAFQDGDRIYGRGSSDMKSGVAAMILALKYIHQSGISLEGNLSFLGTAGEEVDGRGARSAMTQGLTEHATAMVIGEPTDNEVWIAHKGVLWLEIDIFGKTAHAGWPQNGVNAISATHRLVSALDQMALPIHKIVGPSTINLGIIKGGIAPNMVADRCSLTVDIRLIPGQESSKIISHVKGLLDKIAIDMKVRYTVQVLNDMLPVSTPESHAFIKLSAEILQKALNKKPIFGGANYYSDGSLFTSSDANLPVLIFGPGNPGIAHQPDEYVSIKNYLAAIRYYIALAIKYLG